MSPRLFFALWPGERVHAELVRRFEEFTAGATGGRLQRPDQWHVTLEFLGATPEQRVRFAVDAADQVDGEPFELEFDRVDHWRKPQVLLLATRRTPPALGALVDRLRAALAARGFTPEAREYRPHVTLARKVRSAAPAALSTPLRWPADGFALVRSVSDPSGSRYEPLQWWNLRGRTG